MEKIVMFYMYKDIPCTRIEINSGKISIENYTNDVVNCAFGFFKNPTMEQLHDFLEDRCFPEARFNKRQLLNDVNLDYYDPFQIIKLTHGAMSDDLYWIKFENENIKWDDVNPRKESY